MPSIPVAPVVAASLISLRSQSRPAAISRARLRVEAAQLGGQQRRREVQEARVFAGDGHRLLYGEALAGILNG